MANVHYLPGVPRPDNRDPSGLVGPLDIVKGLHALLCARIIGLDAYYLGSLVCQQMQRYDVRQTIATGTDASSCFVVYGGVALTGPMRGDLLVYASALQDLHFRGGVFNDLTEQRVSRPVEEVRSNHFTLSPNTIAGKHYSLETPIYYRLPPITKAQFHKAVEDLCFAAIGSLQYVVLSGE